MKRILKSVLFWIIVFEIVVGIILYVCGFRITYSPYIEYNWEAIGAIGQCAGVIVALLIPIAVIYIQNKLEKNKKEIGEANSELYNELNRYIEKIKVLSELVDEEGNIVIDGGSFSDQLPDYKEKALKFINISMVSNTKRVAEHLGISEEATYDILEEMVRHDRSISCGGQLSKNNLDSIVWTRKSK